MYGLEVNPLAQLGAMEVSGRQFTPRSNIGYIAQEIPSPDLPYLHGGTKLCPEVIYQNESEHARRANAYNLIIDFNVQEHLSPHELSLLTYHNLPPLIPLDLYLSWRSAGHQPPNSDEDFSQFFGFIVDELELFYEASGLELHLPAFGRPKLHDVINQITQPIMEMATRLGTLADPQTQTVFTTHPNARYLIDTCRQMGPNGVGVSFEIQPARDVDDPYEQATHYGLATQHEAQAGTSNGSILTAEMVKRVILDMTSQMNTVFGKLYNPIPDKAAIDPCAAGMVDGYGLGSP